MRSGVSLVVVCLGVALLSLGVLRFFQQRKRIARLLRAEGIVTGLIPVRVEDTSVVSRTETGTQRNPKYRYRPQVRFTTASGRAVDLVSPLSARPPRYEIGARVNVLYDPHDPTDALINGFLERWFSTAMLVFWGVFAMAMGGVGWLMSGS